MDSRPLDSLTMRGRQTTWQTELNGVQKQLRSDTNKLDPLFPRIFSPRSSVLSLFSERQNRKNLDVRSYRSSVPKSADKSAVEFFGLITLSSARWINFPTLKVDQERKLFSYSGQSYRDSVWRNTSFLNEVSSLLRSSRSFRNRSNQIEWIFRFSNFKLDDSHTGQSTLHFCIAFDRQIHTLKLTVSRN